MSLGISAISNGYDRGTVLQPLVSRDNRQENMVIVHTPSGKTIALTKEEYIRLLIEMNRRQNSTPENKKPYELGPEKNGHRIIDSDNVSNPKAPGSSEATTRDTAPSKIEEYKENIDSPNGKIDDFRQGKRGDCYLLSTIESIKGTADGQAILSKNIKQNKDGSITVTLPGAVAVKNHYKEMGYEDKCAITGQYTITQAALEKAKSMAGKSYAYGDIEVIAYELAMEALRAEINQTNKAIGIKSERFIAGQIGPMSENDTLAGGFTYDAVYLLTGQKSDLYEAGKEKRANAKLYRPGEFGYVGEHKKGYALGKAKGIVEIEHYYNKESDLQRMLDKYKGHEDEFTITVGVIVAQNGPDGSTKAGGGHALSVYKITDEYVEVINPWDTTKHERIPRGEFEKMAVRLNVAPVSKEHFDDFYVINGIDKKRNKIIDFFRNLFG